MNLNGPESFIIEIENIRVQQLMDVFSGDYHHLANHLKLMNDRMVLVNPKFQGEQPDPTAEDDQQQPDQA